MAAPGGAPCAFVPAAIRRAVGPVRGPSEIRAGMSAARDRALEGPSRCAMIRRIGRGAGRSLGEGMRIQVIAAALVAVNLGACGSITRGTTEKMAFLSEPAGAQMTTTKGYACPATPCSLEVDRSDEFDVTFVKPGYRPQVIPVRTKVAGSGAAGFAGNILVGGVIGMGVDAATGAALDHTPNPVNAILVPDQPATAPARSRRPRPGAAGF